MVVEQGRAGQLEYACELLDAAAETLQAAGVQWAPREVDEIRANVAQLAESIERGN
ncbi:MAG TPA: hypothetical protein VFI54_06225 [Solirubrobacteraceae bacterium]|nr:hypothetical protein [Solirubrobacteraceae bacterium]